MKQGTGGNKMGSSGGEGGGGSEKPLKPFLGKFENNEIGFDILKIPLIALKWHNGYVTNNLKGSSGSKTEGVESRTKSQSQKMEPRKWIDVRSIELLKTDCELTPQLLKGSSGEVGKVPLVNQEQKGKRRWELGIFGLTWEKQSVEKPVGDLHYSPFENHKKPDFGEILKGFKLPFLRPTDKASPDSGDVDLSGSGSDDV